MKRDIILTITICLIFFSCYNNLKSIKCKRFMNNKEVSKEIVYKIDSVFSTTKTICSKYKITDYKCDSDSMLEVKVKTKCDEKYFIFNAKSELLRIVTVLDDAY